MSELAYTVESTKPFEDISSALERTAPEKNFRVLAIHDVKETLKEKGFEIKPMRIFEVCNAGFAYKAINSDINVAMFMPCKIVVRGEEGRTVMTLVRPSMISQMLPDSSLDDLAADVEKQLSGILDEIK